MLTVFVGLLRLAFSAEVHHTAPESCVEPIRLQQTSSLALERGVVPRGVSRSAKHGVLVWTDHKLIHWSGASADSARSVANPGVPIVAAAFRSDGAISVLLGDPIRIVETLVTGSHPHPTGTYADVGEASDAVFVNDKWIVLAEGANDTWTVVSLESRARRIWSAQRDLRRDDQKQWIRLSRGIGDHVLLTRRTPPFEITDISIDGTKRSVFAGLNGQQLLNGTQGGGAWASLPTLAIACGFLQQVAQRSNNRRVFVTRDRNGVTRRASEVDAPFAFVESSPLDSVLVSVRTLRTGEVVLYRWR